MIKLIFEIEVDDLQDEPAIDDADIFTALYRSFPKSLVTVKAVQQGARADGAKMWTCPCGMTHNNDSLSCPFCDAPRQ